jgi:hypothetical protein
MNEELTEIIAAIINSKKKKNDEKINQVVDYIVSNCKIKVRKEKAKFIGIENADTKLSPQCAIIHAELLKNPEGLTFKEWVAAVEGKIITKQPIDRVVMFYKTQLNGLKLIQVI